MSPEFSGSFLRRRSVPFLAKPIVNDIEIVEKAWGANWAKPVKDGIITSTFGNRINPIKNKPEFHNGLDISAKMGAQAFAVEKGTVLKTGTSPTWGKNLTYKTSDGYTVFYAHLSGITVKEGQSVEKGQEIAKVGSTGLSTGPHLHLTLLEKEIEIDPMSFFDYKLTEEAKAEYLVRGETPPER